MILWIMLIFGVFSLILSAYCFKWHENLNQELNRDPKKVDFDDYLIGGLGAYLLCPASFFIIVGSICCIIFI